MEGHLLIVVILVLLAIADLIVGVSNDAVNFLSSAVGSKAAPFRVVLVVAGLGVLLGAMTSSGMMEIARTGIFDPSTFTYHDVLVIFLAVMLTDIILLDLYNSLGLPTSTTVSIVFELLGAAVMVGWLMSAPEERNIDHVLSLINTSKVSTIIVGIFLSVLIAFAVGALIQWLTRFMFTFRNERNMVRFGPWFAGLAIAFIFQFMLVKGLKGSDLLNGDIGTWINAHSWYVLAGIVLLSGFVLKVLQQRTSVHPLRVVVLMGTFSLAMAFAGNDLVNFIGVPITALQSFELWRAAGEPGDGMLMSGLAAEMRSPTLPLLIAGAVMFLTLWFSAKARKVTATTVDLSRQSVGDEKFRAHGMARAVVRHSRTAGETFTRMLSRRTRVVIHMRFRSNGVLEDAPAFDLLRGAVNLMVASILIAWGTLLKLPLSTTYVTFMVAMGASLADGAWSAGSAEQRVAGVLNVFGGWLLTGLGAFLMAAMMALTLYYGGDATAIGLTALAAFAIVRSHLPRRAKRKRRNAAKSAPITDAA